MFKYLKKLYNPIVSILPVLVIAGVFYFIRQPGVSPFYGDMGWYYFAARDALLSGRWPTTGITSSVTWLHQGPLFTQILIPIFALFSYSPASPYIFISIISIFTVVILFIYTKIVYGFTPAFFASATYLASPLIWVNSRTPYHTSIIPLLILLLIISLHLRRFTLALLLIGLIYQSELVSVILWPFIVWQLIRLKYKFHLFNLAGLLIGFLPWIFTGPLQLFGVLIWGFHRVQTFISLSADYQLLWDYLHQLIAPAVPLYIMYILLLLLSLSIIIRRYLFHFWLLIPLILIFLNHTASEAYFTLLFIPFSLNIALIVHKYVYRYVKPIIIIIIFINIYYLVRTNILTNIDRYGLNYEDKKILTDKMFAQDTSCNYTLRYQGPGSQFVSTLTPYEYLVWYKCRLLPKSNTPKKFLITEPAGSLLMLE